MIVHLQSIANQMPYVFNDATKVAKSHIPAANAPARIDVPVGQNKVAMNDSSGARLKRGRLTATEIILSDKTKHISPKFFSADEIQKVKVIEVI
ncbi:hypothetical protein ACFX19_042033 [Malus domestica]